MGKRGGRARKRDDARREKSEAREAAAREAAAAAVTAATAANQSTSSSSNSNNNNNNSANATFVDDSHYGEPGAPEKYLHMVLPMLEAQEARDKSAERKEGTESHSDEQLRKKTPIFTSKRLKEEVIALRDCLAMENNIPLEELRSGHFSPAGPAKERLTQREQEERALPGLAKEFAASIVGSEGAPASEEDVRRRLAPALDDRFGARFGPRMLEAIERWEAAQPERKATKTRYDLLRRLFISLKKKFDVRNQHILNRKGGTSKAPTYNAQQSKPTTGPNVLINQTEPELIAIGFDHVDEFFANLPDDPAEGIETLRVRNPSLYVPYRSKFASTSGIMQKSPGTPEKRVKKQQQKEQPDSLSSSNSNSSEDGDDDAPPIVVYKDGKVVPELISDTITTINNEIERLQRIADRQRLEGSQRTPRARVIKQLLSAKKKKDSKREQNIAGVSEKRPDGKEADASTVSTEKNTKKMDSDCGSSTKKAATEAKAGVADASEIALLLSSDGAPCLPMAAAESAVASAVASTATSEAIQAAASAVTEAGTASTVAEEQSVRDQELQPETDDIIVLERFKDGMLREVAGRAVAVVAATERPKSPSVEVLRVITRSSQCQVSGDVLGASGLRVEEQREESDGSESSGPPRLERVEGVVEQPPPLEVAAEEVVDGNYAADAGASPMTPQTPSQVLDTTTTSRRDSESPELVFVGAPGSATSPVDQALANRYRELFEKKPNNVASACSASPTSPSEGSARTRGLLATTAREWQSSSSLLGLRYTPPLAPPRYGESASPVVVTTTHANEDEQQQRERESCGEENNLSSSNTQADHHDWSNEMDQPFGVLDTNEQFQALPYDDEMMQPPSPPRAPLPPPEHFHALLPPTPASPTRIGGRGGGFKRGRGRTRGRGGGVGRRSGGGGGASAQNHPDSGGMGHTNIARRGSHERRAADSTDGSSVVKRRRLRSASSSSNDADETMLLLEYDDGSSEDARRRRKAPSREMATAGGDETNAAAGGYHGGAGGIMAERCLEMIEQAIAPLKRNIAMIEERERETQDHLRQQAERLDSSLERAVRQAEELRQLNESHAHQFERMWSNLDRHSATQADADRRCSHHSATLGKQIAALEHQVATIATNQAASLLSGQQQQAKMRRRSSAEAYLNQEDSMAASPALSVADKRKMAHLKRRILALSEEIEEKTAAREHLLKKLHSDFPTHHGVDAANEPDRSPEDDSDSDGTTHPAGRPLRIDID